MTKTKETKVVNLELPADVHRLLKVACAANDLNMSEGVARAIKVWAKTVTP